jgi:hypothetical protein
LGGVVSGGFALTCGCLHRIWWDSNHSQPFLDISPIASAH